MFKIMIVEDSEIICDELAELLTNEGYEVIVLNDFTNTCEQILNNCPDLLLLDINIPFINGEVILKDLRKKSNIPVIMVTSRRSEIDEALSISYGADDYITKPYNPNILLLRISAVLKRSINRDDVIKYKDLSINLQRGVINKGDKEIVLTKNESIIFSYLLTHPNRIVTRDELMTTLWNNNEYINDNALTVNISRLRAKLKEVNYNDAIETRKGQGYLLK